MEHQEIPTLEEHLSSGSRPPFTRDTLGRTLDFLQEVYQLIDQGELDEHDPEYEYYLVNFSNRVNIEDTKQIIEDTDSHPIGIRFGAFFLLVKASLDNFIDYGKLTDINERWGDEFHDRPMYRYIVHKFTSEDSA